MSLSKPFYRIARPKSYIPNYAMDKRYASDRLQLSRAYLCIEKELRNIFNFIEPSEQNVKVFSFELYSLLLRACTEVELNCKLILTSNGYTKSGNFNMCDYKKIQKSSKLSLYKISINNWRYNDEDRNYYYDKKILYPFGSFELDKSPSWYSDYNQVKHNREDNFQKASLENVLNAVAGILILLYSQFGSCCLDTYGVSGMYWQEVEDYDNYFDADTIFEINPPSINEWTTDEQYIFDWNDLKCSSNPFDKFSF